MKIREGKIKSVHHVGVFGIRNSDSYSLKKVCLTVLKYTQKFSSILVSETKDDTNNTLVHDICIRAKNVNILKVFVNF